MKKDMTKLATYSVTGLAAFGLGWVMQPPPTVDMVTVQSPPKVEYVYVDVPTLPDSAFTVVDEPGKPFMIVEREATPQRTDCLVMRWLD